MLLVKHYSQVLAIGDSLEHDIAGAAAAGIDSLFIAGGIHATELGVGSSSSSSGSSRAVNAAVDTAALEQLCASHGATPQFVCTHLQW